MKRKHGRPAAITTSPNPIARCSFCAPSGASLARTDRRLPVRCVGPLSTARHCEVRFRHRSLAVESDEKSSDVRWSLAPSIAATLRSTEAWLLSATFFLFFIDTGLCAVYTLSLLDALPLIH